MYSPVALTFVFTAAVVLIGSVSSVPMQQQQQQQQPQQQQEDVGATGFGSVLWSVLDDCFAGDESNESATVCLKSKALTALDRALSKPTVTVVDGVALSARAGKSLIDPQTEKADRAALDAVKDSDQKNAMLDDMLASRMDRLMSSRSIVLDGPVGQEGRGKKKEKAMQQAMMIAGMVAAAVMGPMAMGMLSMMAGKALLLSKIALVLSGLIALKKLFSPQQSGGGESEAHHHYGRSIKLDAHDMAYSGQKQ